MIDLKTLHLDLLAGAPTGGRLLTDTIVDRNADLAAITEGYPSPGDLAQAVKQFGVVVGASGNHKATRFNASLARKLPVRLKPGQSS
jgi:hypothetical protein